MQRQGRQLVLGLHQFLLLSASAGGTGRFALSLALCLSLCACGASRPAASKLLEATCQRYATTASYEDFGTVDKIYPPLTGVQAQELFRGSGIPDRTEHTRFRTAFRRPGQLRFDLQVQGSPDNPGNWFVLWTAGDLARIWDPQAIAPKKVDEMTLAEGLGALSGATSTVSLVVPGLLLGSADFLCHPIDVSYASWAGDGSYLRNDGVCDVLRVRAPWRSGARELDVCIDQGHVLRAWRATTSIPAGQVTTLVRYEPQLDAPLEDSVFQFAPPDDSRK
jgi:hypothetical protein